MGLSLKIRNPVAAALLAGAVAVPTLMWAATVTVPNTFVNGEVADADAVNDNFNAVKTAVDANDTAIGVNATAIDANDTAIGTNTTAIDANATAIGTNTTALDALDTALSPSGLNITAEGHLDATGSIRAANFRRIVWSTNVDGAYDLLDIFDDGRNAGMSPGIWDCTLRTNNTAHWRGYRFTAALNLYIANASYPHRIYSIVDVRASDSGCDAALNNLVAAGTFDFASGNCVQSVALVCTKLD